MAHLSTGYSTGYQAEDVEMAIIGDFFLHELIGDPI